MFNKVARNFKKNGINLDPKMLAERKFQADSRKKMIEWQIENGCILQPVMSPQIDCLKATFIFVKAEKEQIESLKESLRQLENK